MTHSPTDPIVTQPRNETRLQAENSIRVLQRFGQSAWLDDLRRSLFTGGEFCRLPAFIVAFDALLAALDAVVQSADRGSEVSFHE